MSNSQISINNNVGQSAEKHFKIFETLYDEYAPKALGFIIKHTGDKQKAEEFLTNVFLKVWQEIETLEEHTDKKFLKILLMTCRPIYKSN